MTMTRACLLFFGAFALTGACARDQDPSAPVDGSIDFRTPATNPVTPPGTIVPVPPQRPANEVARFQNSGINDRRRVVISDPVTWAAVWAQANATNLQPPPVPAIDFDTEVVVLASMGTKNSGGYSIDIISAAVVDGQLRVVVRETSPGPGCMRTAALTAPVHIVRAPHGGAPAFIEQSFTRNC